MALRSILPSAEHTGVSRAYPGLHALTGSLLPSRLGGQLTGPPTSSGGTEGAPMCQPPSQSITIECSHQNRLYQMLPKVPLWGERRQEKWVTTYY